MNIRRIVLASALGVGLAFAGTGAALAHDQQGMMQQGQGPMMGQGQGMMMGPGMGYGMMQPGQWGSMMGPGMMMGHGMCGGGYGMMGRGMHSGKWHHGKRAGMDRVRKLLSVDDAKERIESWLAEHLGDRVKVGAIKVEGVFAITAEIKTVDDSLIENVIIDRRNGSVWRAD